MKIANSLVVKGRWSQFRGSPKTLLFRSEEKSTIGHSFHRWPLTFYISFFVTYPPPLSLHPSIWSKIRSRVVRRNSVSRDDEWRKPNELFIFIINLVALFIIDIPRLRTTDIRSAAICIFNSHRFDFIVDRSCWKICHWGDFREENHFIDRNEYFFRKKIKKLINY